jgi:hypothetical protein
MKNKPMKHLMAAMFLFITTICFPQMPIANAPAIQWQKNFGGSSYGTPFSLKLTSDGGYIVAGNTESNDGDVTNHHGGTDIWVLKLNDTGAIQWQKALGGSKEDNANSIQQTRDGGYIIVGTTNSTDGDVTNKIEENGIDFWVIKLDGNGNLQWQKVFGGDSYDTANSVQQTKDGGYIVAGYSRSNFNNKKKEYLLDGFNDDNWILKLDPNGNLQWQKLFGGEGLDHAQSIQQTNDNGFILVGSSNKSILTSLSDFNFSIIKLNETGEVQWEKSLGGTNDEYAYSVQQTKDGGYIVAGTTKSIDGDVTNVPGGGTDIWVVKLNNIGTVVWQKVFGETALDFVYEIKQTSDEGYILVGNTGLKDVDGLVIKLNNKGNMEWQKTIGGTQFDIFKSIVQTKDNGYIIVGTTNSSDEDLKENNMEKSNFWIIKLK